MQHALGAERLDEAHDRGRAARNRAGPDLDIMRPEPEKMPPDGKVAGAELEPRMQRRRRDDAPARLRHIAGNDVDRRIADELGDEAS